MGWRGGSVLTDSVSVLTQRCQVCCTWAFNPSILESVKLRTWFSVFGLCAPQVYMRQTQCIHMYTYINLLKIKLICRKGRQQGGTLIKDACHQIWSPEFDLWDKWWKERTSSYRLFSDRHARTVAHAHALTDTVRKVTIVMPLRGNGQIWPGQRGVWS